MNPHRNEKPVTCPTVDRRRAIQATLAMMAPALVSARSLGLERQVAASDRINVAMIGCGKMAKDYHLPELLKQADVQLVAVCEVDQERRKYAAGVVNQHYGSTGAAGCAEYVDFREVLARTDFDAVCIATPDHWHAIPAIEACKAGKDVYCEKPLTLTIAEAQRCIEAARKHQRIFQVGSQQRSNVFGPFCEAVDIIRSGRLGKIHRVTVGVGAPSVLCDLPEEEKPVGLEWDLWLGQAPLRPYHSVLSPRGLHNHFPNWRGYREYSGGGHTDMGAHHYDIAMWALDRDATGPVKILPPADPSATTGVKYVFADGLEVEHGGPSGCTFYGERGTLRVDRGHLSSDPEALVKEPLGDNVARQYRSPGHHRNWLDCIKSRQRPVADVEAGARTVTMIHLGNLAYWEKREFAWQPATWSFGDPADQKWLDRPRRDPWQLPKVDG